MAKENSNFKDKTIWITGASSGIGKAMAEALAPSGARLILSGRRVKELEALAEALLEGGAKNAKALPFDLENPSEINNAVNEFIAKWRAPDILILSGGLSQRSLVAETEMVVYRRLMEVDYFANVSITKALMPQWELNRSGQIVVISSLVGKIPTPYRSGYAAAKHALHGFYESLRAENPNLKINLICPGFIKTQVSVNALTGNNESLGIMDRAQAEGMPAEIFAKKALRSIQQNRALSLIGGKEVWGVHLNRFLPGLFRKIIGRARVR